LLTLSRKLIDDGEFGIAIVVAHMACEIATERTLSEAFAAKGIPYLEDSVTDLLSGYNLANPRIRKLYTALTGDDLANAPFGKRSRHLLSEETKSHIRRSPSRKRMLRNRTWPPTL
jgi:hypothetical protein